MEKITLGPKETQRAISNLSDLAERLEPWEDVFDKYPNLYYKGGIARSVGLYLLAGQESRLRDNDFIFVGYLGSDVRDDMRGRGEYDIEEVESIDRFLEETDFTVNQCLFRPDKFIMTVDAAKDIADNALRNTPYEDIENWGVSDRMGYRAMVFMCRHGLEPVGKMASKIKSLDAHYQTFNTLIHLIKTMETNDAECFVDLLREYSNIYDKTPGELLIRCLSDVVGFELMGREGKMAQYVAKELNLDRNGNYDSLARRVLKSYPKLANEVKKWKMTQNADYHDTQLAIRWMKLNRIAKNRKGIEI